MNKKWMHIQERVQYPICKVLYKSLKDHNKQTETLIDQFVKLRRLHKV